MPAYGVCDDVVKWPYKALPISLTARGVRGYDDDINKTTRGLIDMMISLIKETDYCAQCGGDCAPPDNIYIDPICTGCAFMMRSDDIFPAPMPAPRDLAKMILIRDIIDMINISH